MLLTLYTGLLSSKFGLQSVLSNYRYNVACSVSLQGPSASQNGDIKSQMTVIPSVRVADPSILACSAGPIEGKHLQLFVYFLVSYAYM